MEVTGGATSVVVVADLPALAQLAAAELVARAQAALLARGRFTWALSGGSSPRSLYSLLATDPRYRDALDWRQVHFFWGDERHVGPEHPESNYRMARETMLDKLAVPAANVHRMAGERASAEEAAWEYEEELARCFPQERAAGDFPRFDLVLLGIGPEGHTASLFPENPVLAETRRWVVAPWVEKLQSSRITLSLPALNAAACALFFVEGAAKADAVHQVLEGPPRPTALPAQRIRPVDGELLWRLDRAAASRLSSR